VGANELYDEMLQVMFLTVLHQQCQI